ncbi:hypothetical protein [Microbacterium lacticum]|nr:hypothetical protein [Microbacterium lacticum]
MPATTVSAANASIAFAVPPRSGRSPSMRPGSLYISNQSSSGPASGTVQ